MAKTTRRKSAPALQSNAPAPVPFPVSPRYVEDDQLVDDPGLPPTPAMTHGYDGYQGEALPDPEPLDGPELSIVQLAERERLLESLQIGWALSQITATAAQMAQAARENGISISDAELLRLIIARLNLILNQVGG